MRRTALIAATVASLILGTAGIAGASSDSRNFYANGIWCKSAAGGVVCVAMDGSRYGVAISNKYVLVYDNDHHRNVFVRSH